MAERLLDKRWPWIAALGAIAIYFLASSVRFGPPSDPRPVGGADDVRALAERSDLNVLYILIDTLRSDRLGAYGYERDSSPAIDAFAAGGVRFARQLAQSSWTKCSMASLWSGLNPGRIGVTRHRDVVPEQAQMPAETLKAAGFRTVGIYRNGWVSSNFGFGQGFDVYMRPVGRPPPGAIRVHNPTISMRGTDVDATETAKEFLRVSGRDRWFLYLHLMDVHEYLYTEETALFGGGYSDIYDNSIRWVDSVIEDLLLHLRRHGFAENTLVVINADHGEAFRERGFEGHARWVYKESTEVPLILGFPFRLEPGVVVDTRSSNVDVWPTVLDLIGLDTPDALDGRSRVPEILAALDGSSAAETSTPAVAHLDRRWGRPNADPSPTVAVADGRFRYVRWEDDGRRLEQLFDATHDPAELEDRFEAAPEDAARLRAIADAYAAQPPVFEVTTREMDEMELNQLRALGYAIP